VNIRRLAAVGAVVLSPFASHAQVTAQFYAGFPTTAPGLGGSFGGLTAFCTAQLPSISFVDRDAFVTFVTNNCAGRPAAFDGFNFSARFTGAFAATSAGSYTFTGQTDDGNSFWINSTNVRSSWGDQSGGYGFNATLTGTPTNAFQFDYYANTFGLSFLTVNLPTGVTYAQPITVVPEPGAIWLLVTGMLALVAWRRRRV
jgi:hypothetical protein